MTSDATASTGNFWDAIKIVSVLTALMRSIESGVQVVM